MRCDLQGFILWVAEDPDEIRGKAIEPHLYSSASPRAAL
jgi:hypothetical protein